jgi:hypothetical protein
MAMAPCCAEASFRSILEGTPSGATLHLPDIVGAEAEPEAGRRCGICQTNYGSSAAMEGKSGALMRFQGRARSDAWLFERI